MTDDQHLTSLAEQLGQLLVQRKFTLTFAESCTGGLCAEIITRISGSSAWFDCGFITYSNQSKEMLLNVSSNTLSSFGAVSEEVAIEMANGALSKSPSTLSASVTGIAGPTGGSKDKPVGTVCFAWAGINCQPRTATHHFIGNRQQIRLQSAKTVIEGLISLTLSLDL